LGLHRNQVYVDAREPIAPVAAPFRNGTVGDIGDVDAASALRHGSPCFAGLLVVCKCELSRVGISGLLIDLKEHSAAQFMGKEGAEPDLDEHVLLKAAEFRRRLRSGGPACSVEGIARRTRAIFNPLRHFDGRILSAGFARQQGARIFAHRGEHLRV